MNLNKFASVGALTLILGLASCGGSSSGGASNSGTAVAYFGNFAQQIQVAQGQGNTNILNVLAATLCAEVPEVENTSNTVQKITLKDCEVNGVQTNGTITQTLTVNDQKVITKSKVSGTLNFKVIDPTANKVEGCADTLKEGQTSSCSISTTDSLNADKTVKTTGTICGMSTDDFVKAVTAGSCKGTAAKKTAKNDDGNNEGNNN